MFCALTDSQIRSFYKYIYKSIVSNPDNFKFNDLVQDVYNTVIDSQKNEALALTHVSLIPQMLVSTWSTNSEVRQIFKKNNVDLNKISDLIDLWGKDIEEVKKVIDAKTIEGVNSGIQAKISAQNSLRTEFTPEAEYAAIETGDKELSQLDQEGAKPASAQTTTGQQASGDFTEDVDPTDTNKLIYYNTQAAIRTAFAAQKIDFSQLVLTAKDGTTTKGVQLVAVHDSQIPESNRYKANQGRTEEGVYLAISDMNGNLLKFNTDGVLDKDGAFAITFMRAPKQDAKTGEYYLISPTRNRDILQDPTEMAFKASKNTEQKVDDLITMFEKARQAEFKRVDDIRKYLLTNKDASVPLPITGISAGIIKTDYRNLTPLNKLNTKLEFRLAKELEENLGLKAGGVYFTIPGVKANVLVIRPFIPNHIAQTITELAFSHMNTKDQAYKAIKYIRGMILNDKESLWFGVDKNNQISVAVRVGSRMETITNDKMGRLALTDILRRRKLNINKSYLSDGFFDYMEYKDGKFDTTEMNYNDFIKNNFMTAYQVDSEGNIKALNSYIEYSAPEIGLPKDSEKSITEKTPPTNTDDGENIDYDSLDNTAKEEYILQNSPLNRNAFRSSEAFINRFEEGRNRIKYLLEKNASKRDILTAERYTDNEFNRRDEDKIYDEILKEYALNEKSKPIEKTAPTVTSKTGDLSSFENRYERIVTMVKDPGQQLDALNKLFNLFGHTEVVTTEEDIDKAYDKIHDKLEAEGKAAKLEAALKDIVPVTNNTPVKKNPLSDLNKEVGIDNKATTAQIEAVRPWWNSSPLSKHVSLEIMFDIVNSNALATYNNASIKLYAGANFTDLYHEAFHAFTQMYLTKEQKLNLYNEARQLDQFKGKSDLDIEESLAEDFRKYVLSDGTLILGERPARNTIWRRIINFLKSLFTGKSYKELTNDERAYGQLQETYDKLYHGNLNEYTPSIINAQFGVLNKGIEGKEDKLSNAESMLLSNSIDSIIHGFLQENGQSVSLLFSNKKALPAAYQGIRDVFEERLAEPDTTEYQKHILQFALNNFKETLSYHADKSKYLEVNKKTVENSFDKDGNIIDNTIVEENDDTSEAALGKQAKDSMGSKGGNEESTIEMANNETLYLVSGLYQREKDGSIINNELGFPKLVDFQPTWNRVLKATQGTLDPMDMMKKLLALSKEYPEFNDLVARLDISHERESNTNFNTVTKFWQDFNKPRIPIYEGLIDRNPGGDIIYKFGEAKPQVRKVIANMNDKFQTMLNSPYIGRNSDGDNVLNIDKVLEDFAVKNYSNTYANRNIPKLERPFTLSIKLEKTREFLEAIGINLSNKPEIEETIKQLIANEKLDYLIAALSTLGANGVEVTSPVESLMAPVYKGKVRVTEGEGSTINALLEAEAKYSDDYSNYSVINAEGNIEYEHSLNNFFTITFNNINNVDKFPTYQSLVADPRFNRYNIDKNPNMIGSVMLQSLFMLDRDSAGFGQRRTNYDGSPVTVELINFNGVKTIMEDSKEEGTKTANLDRFSKFLQDFNSFLQYGKMEVPRHGSKSSAFGMYISKVGIPTNSVYTNGLLYIPIEDVILKTDKLNGTLRKVLVGYLTSELTRIKQRIDNNVGENIPVYSEQASKFQLFDDILPTEIKDKLISAVTGDNGIALEDIEAFINSNRELDKHFKHYFDQLEGENWKELSNAPIVSSELLARVQSFAKEVEEKLSKEDQLKALNKAFTYNAWIHNIESMKFVYDDLAFYKLIKEEFHKRNTRISATGTIARTDASAIQFINEHRLGERKQQFDGTFNTAILKDTNYPSTYIDEYGDAFRRYYTERASTLPEDLREQYINESVEKELSAYRKMTEGDAQGWITLDAYRIFKTLQGIWPDESEKLYLSLTGGNIETTHWNSRSMSELFPPIKAQYAGPIQSDMLSLPGFHKFSLVPLIPSVIKGTNFEHINNNLKNNNIDYALFESGSKLATITKDGSFDKMYEDYEKRTPYTGDYTPNKIFLDYLKEQVNIEPHFKNEVIFSTQLRKLILNNLFKEGVAISAKALEYASSFEKNVAKLTRLRKANLIKELGITGEEGNYDIKDYRPIAKALKKEFSRRDMPDHVIDFIDVNKDGTLRRPLDLSTASQKIESMLMSMVNSRLVRQKVNGEPLIQVSGSGFELGSSLGKYTNPTEADKAKWGTNDLPTYRENGRTLSDGTKVTSAAKVKVALSGQFEHLLELNTVKELAKEKGISTIDALNELIKDEDKLDKHNIRDLITMVGVPIPVQGLNSMEFMEVYHFLPKEAGNIIIPPSEIVAKSGGDFDIYKLSIFKPNIVNHEGKITLLNTRDHYDDNEELWAKFHERIKLAERDRDDALYAINKVFIKDIDNSPISTADKQAALNMAREFNSNKKQLNAQIEGLTALYVNIMTGKAGNDTRDADDVLNNIDQARTDLKILTKNYLDNTKQYIEAYKDEYINGINGKSALIQSLHNEYRGLKDSNIKAVQNELIKNIRNILEMTDNFVDLIKPNGTDIVKPIADRLEDIVSEYNPSRSKLDGKLLKVSNKKYVPGTRTMETRYNLYKHESNNIGKDALSIGAVDNTFNTLLNRAGAYLNTSYNFRTVTGIQRREIKLLFNEYNKMDIDGVEHISMSNIFDARNLNKIADVISQLMNGWVDIEKDAWIFNVNGGLEAAPVILLLNQMGVPFNTIAQFITQPSILKYVAGLKVKSNLFLKAANPYKFTTQSNSGQPMNIYKANLKRDILSSYLGITINRTSVPELQNLISSENYKHLFTEEGLSKSRRDARLQAVALIHFLELLDVASTLTSVRSSLNFDTSKTPDIFSAQQKITDFKEAIASQIMPNSILEHLKNDSVISSFAVQPFAVELGEKLLPLRNNPILNSFIASQIKELPLNLQRANSVRFARTFKNDLLQYVYQNHAIPKNIDWKSLFGNPTLSRVRIGLDSTNIERIINGTKTTTVKSAAQANAIGLADKETGIMVLRGNHFKVTNLGPVTIQEAGGLDKFLKGQGVSSINELSQPMREWTEGKGKLNIYQIQRIDAPLGDQLVRLKSEFPELAKKYTLVDSLSRNQSKENLRLVNIRLRDGVLDTNKINQYYDEFKDLINPDIKKVDNEQDNQRISKFFTRVATFGFLQSGLNKSPISYSEVIPQELYTRWMEKPLQTLKDNLSSKYLQEFSDKFKANNPALIGGKTTEAYRYKDYTSTADEVNKINDKLANKATNTSEVVTKESTAQNNQTEVC